MSTSLFAVEIPCGLLRSSFQSAGPLLFVLFTAVSSTAADPARADLQEQARRCRQILKTSIIDFYLPACVDTTNGGYLESLRGDRFAPTGEKFLTLQARQLWFFSTLAAAGIEKDAALAAAKIRVRLPRRQVPRPHARRLLRQGVGRRQADRPPQARLPERLRPVRPGRLPPGHRRRRCPRRGARTSSGSWKPRPTTRHTAATSSSSTRTGGRSPTRESRRTSARRAPRRSTRTCTSWKRSRNSTASGPTRWSAAGSTNCSSSTR